MSQRTETSNLRKQSLQLYRKTTFNQPNNNMLKNQYNILLLQNMPSLSRKGNEAYLRVSSKKRS